MFTASIRPPSCLRKLEANGSLPTLSCREAPLPFPGLISSTLLLGLQRERPSLSPFQLHPQCAPPTRHCTKRMWFCICSVSPSLTSDASSPVLGKPPRKPSQLLAASGIGPQDGIRDFTLGQAATAGAAAGTALGASSAKALGRGRHAPTMGRQQLGANHMGAPSQQHPMPPSWVGPAAIACNNAEVGALKRCCSTTVAVDMPIKWAVGTLNCQTRKAATLLEMDPHQGALGGCFSSWAPAAASHSLRSSAALG